TARRILPADHRRGSAAYARRCPVRGDSDPYGRRGHREGVRLRDRGVGQEATREARGDRRPDRLPEPPRPVGRARGGARSRAALQSRPHHPARRHRPVQAGERHPRPHCGGFGPAPSRRDRATRSAVGGPGRPLRGGGVRRRDARDGAPRLCPFRRAAAAARDAPRFRRPGRGPAQPDDLNRGGVFPRRPRHQRRQLRGARRPSPLSREERRGQFGASMSERRCPKCGTVYADSARFCPRDGNMLVEVQAKPATPRPPPAPPSAGGTAVRTPPQAKPGLDRAASLWGEGLDSRYQVQEKLGEGGMSYVYLAREVSTGHDVAIKVLSPKLATDRSSVERLRREAGLAMRLDHPNVCRILRLDESKDGLIYLVMPFLKGELLSDREVRGGPMDIPLSVALLKQMCAGLHHAHELQIIHRDLKPENVMLVPDDGGGIERAVVMDFGLAKERRADPAIAKLTATGIILGTPEFMSPEQIRGKTLDARSDLYALGIVAFEMLTGKLPFQGRNAQEMMIARLRSQPVPIRQYRPDVPEPVERALSKALQTNPDDRFMTAIEFGDALTAGGSGSSAASSEGFLSKLRGKLS